MEDVTYDTTTNTLRLGDDKLFFVGDHVGYCRLKEQQRQQQQRMIRFEEVNRIFSDVNVDYINMKVEVNVCSRDLEVNLHSMNQTCQVEGSREGILRVMYVGGDS